MYGTPPWYPCFENLGNTSFTFDQDPTSTRQSRSCETTRALSEAPMKRFQNPCITSWDKNSGYSDTYTVVLCSVDWYKCSALFSRIVLLASKITRRVFPCQCGELKRPKWKCRLATSPKKWNIRCSIRDESCTACLHLYVLFERFYRFEEVSLPLLQACHVLFLVFHLPIFMTSNWNDSISIVGMEDNVDSDGDLNGCSTWVQVKYIFILRVGFQRDHKRQPQTWCYTTLYLG